MSRSKLAAILAGGFFVLSAAVAPAAIVAGQTDTFQDNTTADWGGGDDLSVQSGGIAGPGDLYLHLESFGGSSSGSKLATYNAFEWSGDYAAAGVTAISMDLLNPNTTPVATPLNMRLVLFGPSGSQWASTNGVVIPADNQWHHASFSTEEVDLVPVIPGDSYSQMIGNVSKLMVRYDASASPSTGGSTFAGTLGIDNVTAVAVPEPTGVTILGAAAIVLLMRDERVAGKFIRLISLSTAANLP
jgi:hypothetical protein